MAFKMAGLDMDEGEIKVTEDLLVSLINLMRDTRQEEMSMERANLGDELSTRSRSL